MPKKVPSEYTGRFSVKPKKPTSKLKEPSTSPSREKEPAALAENLGDEPVPCQERKRKLSGDNVEETEEGSSSQTRDEAEVLDIYSQQLEVQPPAKKRKFQMAEQIDVQGQQVVMTRDSEPTDSQLQEQTPYREPETIPGPAATHQYHREALEILRNSWQRRIPSQPDIHGLSRALADRATNCLDAETILFPRYVTTAIMDYAAQQPQALDYMLQAYAGCLKLLPNSITNKHAGGTDATITQLKWLLIKEVSGFHGFLLQESSATIDVEDHSNLKFRYESVSSNLEGVLTQIRDWKWQRRLWFVAAASQARCFSLDILRKKVGQQVEALIDAGLNRKQERWSKVDMLGACVLLRGCAQSLKSHVPSSRVKIFTWKESLEKFMLQDEESWDNDFVIKAHAAVRNPLLALSPAAANNIQLALTNLIDGPFDETSEQLFAPSSWVF